MEAPRSSRRRVGRVVLVAVAVAAVTGPTGWLVTDALEADDDFCNACHLEPGVPLHARIREDYDARPPVNLASLHAAAGVATADRTTRAFRCIDCHGGAGIVGRTRTKILAAKDAFWYVVGEFDEPDEMAWPLWDGDCRKCHAEFDPPIEDAPVPAFHAIGLHNVELGVGCVECHDAHGTGGLEDMYHLHPAAVRRECARCHAEYR